MQSDEQFRSETLAQLRDQVDIYGQALPIAIHLADRYDLSNECQTNLARLGELMNEAALRNQKLAAQSTETLRAMLQYPEIRQTSRELSEQIDRLMKVFATLEEQATRLRQNMQPATGPNLLRSRIRSAYSTEPAE
jgi:hypothetical protein